MDVPVERTASAVIALIVPVVPTGMNAGVSIFPWAVEIVAARAAPSLASSLKVKTLRIMPPQ
jgi:hypothetical protein